MDVMRSIHLALLAALFTGAVAQPLASEVLSVVYDPTLPSRTSARVPAAATRAVSAGLTKLKSSLPADCPALNTVRAYSTATGAFTRKNASEQLHLVEVCEFVLVAVITEGAQVRAASTFSPPGRLIEGFAARDINADGLSELAVAMDYGDGGCGSHQLLLLQFPAGTPRPLGELGVKLNCAPEVGAPGFDYRVYVSKGKTPVFIGVDRAHAGRLVRLSLKRANVMIPASR